MSGIVLIVPGSIETRTGGYEYDRRIAAGLRHRGWTVVVRELDGSFPRPSTADLHRASLVLAEIADGTTVLVDGLAFSAVPEIVERECRRLTLAAVIHMPLAAETGLTPDQSRQAESSERRALAGAQLVIATGRPTVEAMRRYGVPSHRLMLIEPGTDPAPLARGSGEASVAHLLCVAAITPGKGHAALFRALASIERRDWRLTCVGSLNRSPETVQGCLELLRQTGIEDRVTMAGGVDADDLPAAYDRADLFVLATLHETYGMVVAEALARGLPIVASDTGAIADLVGDEAGIVVPPGDERALAHALRSALDPRVREKLAAGARRRRERLRSWDDAVAGMESALRSIDA